jgi:hypothetical protein
MVTDRGQAWSAVDGMVSLELDPPQAVAFPRGMPTEVQMLRPQWLAGSEHAGTPCSPCP